MVAQFQSKVLLLIFLAGTVAAFLDSSTSTTALLHHHHQRSTTTNSCSPSSSLFFHWGGGVNVVDNAGVESFQAMLLDQDFLTSSSFSSLVLGKETARNMAESTSIELATGGSTTTSSITSTTASGIASIFISSYSSSSSSTSEELESEFLLDVSHLFLDFSVFVTENKPILKVAQVIGRILILAQDYIPDKHVSPEELGIQVVMIALCIGNKSQVGPTSSR